MTTDKGGAPAETDAIRAKSGVGSGSLEDPITSIDEQQYQLIEVRQTTLAEFDDWFTNTIKTMDDAVTFWEDVVRLEGLVQVQKGRYLRNIDRYIDGGLSGFCERVELARRNAYYFINIAELADDEKVCSRLHTLGPEKTAVIERTPEPDVIYEWVDAQEKVPTKREIIDQIVETFKPEKPPTPEGKYDIIVVDPPWPLGDIDYTYADRRNKVTARLERPYHRMPLNEIYSLELPAADDCILWLWTTNVNLHNAFHVLESWGFTYRSCLTWSKSNFGLGYWLRGKTEHCLLATKGSPKWTNTTETTLLHGKTREDSRKPDEFYVLVDKICSGKKIDMFSREKREGWDQWGNLPEADTFT